MENQIGDVFWNILFPIIATALVGYVVWWLQRNTKTSPLETLINEIQEERNELKKNVLQWKADYEAQRTRIAELEIKIKEYLTQIDDFEKIKRNLTRRVETLEGEAKAHDRERENWMLEKKSLMATLNGQNDKIIEQDVKIMDQDVKIQALTNQLRAVKISTDELKKQTAELNQDALRRKDDDTKAG